MSSNPADLLPQARIRIAALELFGRQGFDRTTIRQVASRAGVSPGLVIHHFGSKDGLREACDTYVMELVGQEREFFFTIGAPTPRMRTYLDTHPEMLRVFDYLVQALREGGEVAGHVFAKLCDLTDDLMAQAEALGFAHLPDDREATIALLVSMSVGFLLVADQFAERLGATSFEEPDVVQRYAAVASDLFTHGVFTEEYLTLLKNTTLQSDQGE
ncbi:TetR/AcrR family transcriptional regulator [Brooklawnia cerclae]|uniref:AcrR family transcriptional regulator n=1 Tax=Brooklawnia cerclae TaxID=349934 RepID=A0ABX0SHK5_9ACTN|nr:TetR/AcrR family transcriptional regulator [Brooklawnia cerclae]NIH57888.1 AcrR family transcriptional regulator [Brooklawnia cerclae]